MKKSIILLLLFADISFAVNLAYSTYLKDGFTPRAMASDAQGNLYLAGNAVTDPASGATSAVVAKLDPRASGFLYFAYLDSAASDDARAIAVDSAGNAYVAGVTMNPNFPATSGRLGTAPANPEDVRSFVTKLSPTGAVIFSVLVGGSVRSTVDAIALTPQGQILISGISSSGGFPVTPGAYTAPDSIQRPYLMELDASATTMIFSAIGTGGSAIAVDGSGNIYVSGSTFRQDYPTTPGAYQTEFTPTFTCSGLCQIAFPAPQQYLTKVNSTGSQLIYSTGVNGVSPNSGPTGNTGLAVDAAGNAYLTGVLNGSGSYPFTSPLPADSPYEIGFLTKLDAAGAKVLYSIPIGGGGIRIDSSGAVYVAGTVTGFNAGENPPRTAIAVPAALAWVPSQCLPDNITATNEVYAAKLDPASGTVVDTQWIDGSALYSPAVTLASGKVWITGGTQRADVPITPGALSLVNPGLGVVPGAFLSAVDFSQPATSPRIACVIDGGNPMHVGPVAPNQLLTLFGANLGPATGVVAPDGLDSSIAGVSVTFDGNPAQLLYVSSSQINVLTPTSIAPNAATVMQVSVNGTASSPRQLAVTASNPNLFADLSQNGVNCFGGVQGLTPVANNTDGSRNSCSNPAKVGSIVSSYVHGIGSAACGSCFDVTVGGLSAAVVNVMAVNAFVTRVDVQLPNSLAGAGIRGGAQGGFTVGVRLNGTPIGPVMLPNSNVVSVHGALTVWATQ